MLILSELENGDQLQQQLVKSGYKILRRHKLSYGNLFVVNQSEKADLQSLKSKFSKLIIERNNIIEFEKFQEPLDIENFKSESLFSKQWGLHNTGKNTPIQDGYPAPRAGVAKVDTRALSAWDITTGLGDIIIAVMDTGVDIHHPDLIENVFINTLEKNGVAGVDDDGNGIIDDINGYDFADNDNNVADFMGHGTHVAGIIGAAHNSFGTMGIMGQVKILPLKIFKDSNILNREAVVRALDYAVNLGAVVAANSWGGGTPSEIIKNAIRQAGERNLLFVASAGNNKNNNDRERKYPAGYNLENIISVASHNHRDELSYFSNYGKNTVDLLAPGHFILSTFPGNKYKVWSGTSMAAPHVSGAIGLLLNHVGNMSFKEIKTRLLETTTPSFNYFEKTKSMGRLNLYNLLENIRPDRGLPKDREWLDYQLASPINFVPLAKNMNKVFQWKIPGAKFIRVVIKDFDLRRDNFANIRDPKQWSEFHLIEGIGERFYSKYIKSDEIGIRITSGRSSRGKIVIEKLQYIKE